MNIILVTGCSSGFGLETARLFLDRGWTVIATMRTPKDDVLPASDRLRILPLDVTDAGSIAACVEAAGPISALVNNAGIGLMNALEGTSDEQLRAVFDTNTIGLIAMTRAVLPQMRERRAGVVVNVTSAVTLRPLRLLSVYSASKAAVNAFTESLALEVEPFGIRARLVIPGRAPGTAFSASARGRSSGNVPAPYTDQMRQIAAASGQAGALVTHASDVSDAVWRAVTDIDSPHAAACRRGRDGVGDHGLSLRGEASPVAARRDDRATRDDERYSTTQASLC